MAPQVWWQQTSLIKKWGAVASAVTAIIVALTTVLNALAVGEPHWVATRGFTRGEVAAAKTEIKTKIEAGDTQQNAQLTALHSRLVEAELVRARDRKFEMGERIASHRLLLSQNPDLLPGARDIINRQIAQLAEEVSSLERRIDVLERELSGRRP